MNLNECVCVTEIQAVPGKLMLWFLFSIEKSLAVFNTHDDTNLIWDNNRYNSCNITYTDFVVNIVTVSISNHSWDPEVITPQDSFFYTMYLPG